MDKLALRSYQINQAELAQLDSVLERLEITCAHRPRPPEYRRLRGLYNAKRAELLQRMAAIEAAIEALPDRERVVMRAHYLQGADWDAIAETLHYCTRQVHRIHARALQRVEASSN